MQLYYIINNTAIMAEIKRLPILMRKEALKKGLTEAGHELAGYIKSDKLRGGTKKYRLAVQSGALMRSTRGMRVKISGEELVGGVSFGVEYAGIHIGKAGQITTIEPKHSKYLSIPLPPARTKGGTSKRPSPKDYKDLQFIMSKKGNKLLVLIDKKTKKITPYFLLLSFVKIKTRIHPERILKRKSSLIERAMERGINRVIARAA